MEVTITNFRAFKCIRNIRIAPLTVLVGENSAGKTSFLAAIRFIYEVFLNPESASFNREPFLLGAYDQIAHVRGGKSGRATAFSFKIETQVEVQNTDKIFPAPDGGNKTGFERVSCEIEFRNEFSIPALSKITLDFEGGNLTLERLMDGKLSLKTNSFEKTVEDDPLLGIFTADQMMGRSLILMMDEIPFMLYRSLEKSKNRTKHLNKIDLITAKFRALRRQLRASIYASAPVRTEPGRAYTPLDASPSPQGAHVPYLLARLKRHDVGKWNSLKEKIDAFGKSSGMFNTIDVKNLGRSESDPFQIYFDFGGPKRNIIDVGYGISQVLPLITEVMSRDIRTKFLFQQPEVHLHPQAQAALGTFLAESASQRRHSFIVESHSDYIIDRVRVAVRDKVLDPLDVNILYFSKNRLESNIVQISIDRSGNIINHPPGYRQFFLEEEQRSVGTWQ